AQAQNFEFRVKAAPLPKTLIPTPDELSLKLQPLDLKPLAPFIPKSVGLLGGNVRADLVAKLGAAVPDGKGPTTVKGDVKAAGLVFAGAEGGRALDVSLDTDVKADAVKGDLQLDVLTLRAGSAAIIGKGRASGLLSSSPKVEGLEVRGQDLDLSKLAAYYPPLTKMLGAQVEGPIGLLLTAAGDSGAQALKLELDFTPVRLMVPAQLSKAAGAPMTLTARAQASGDKAIAFNATMNLSGADLRPGLVLNKPPGAKTDFALSGTYRNEPTRVDIPSFTAHLLEDTVEGRATAEMKPKSTTFDVAVKSARLNADALLLETEEPAAGSKAPAPPPPAEDPSRFDGMRGKVRAEIASLRMQKSDFAQVLAQLSMVNDALTVDSFTTQAFGGKIDASGSSIKLGPVQRPFVAKLQMRSIDMGAAAGMASTKKMVGGTFNGDINLEGAGTEMESLSQTLAGNLDGKMLNAVLPGTDLLAEVTQPLAKALPFGGSALKSPGGSTSLGKEIDLGLTIQKGVALLKKPIKVDRPEMGLELAGGMRLTGDLDLGGALSLSPQTISAVTRGKATPKEAIPVALKITGPIWKPVVSGLDLKPALKSIASQAMGGLAERFLGDKAKAVTGVTDNAQQVAQQRAAEEKGKAEAAAREEAEKAKKRAADEAKKGLKGIFGR
ncbi:MAG TPA: AsmA-like C-terminal region-containing protein, partial [Myxococcaceae bacterium]|nr:AsmA-like C-terminal region-containing protein [Myxococcaceae bacterium]